MAIDILQALQGKWTAGTRPKDLFAAHIKAEPDRYVPVLLQGLAGDHAKVRNGCAELASLTAEHAPEALYPHRQRFIAQLEAKAPMLRWEAACTVGHLAAVDEGHELAGCVEPLVGMLAAPSIVLQGHAAKALARLAAAMPEHRGVIQEALLGAAGHFPGNRVGFIVECMGVFAGDRVLAERARAFVRPYTGSEIGAVKRKARRTMKALDKGVALEV